MVDYFNIPQNISDGVVNKATPVISLAIENEVSKRLPNIIIDAEGVIQKINNPYILGIAVDKIVNPKKEAKVSNPYIGKIDLDNTIYAATPLYKGDLGTNVYADVTFDSITYNDGNGKQITTPKMTLVAILIALTFPRNIVKTEIQGRNGTVKEYIGEADAHISFSGVITAKNGQNPSAQVIELLKVIQAPVAIPVICSYLNEKGIYNIVFEDRNLSQMEGGFSYQQFSLSAISDTPQELLIAGI